MDSWWWYLHTVEFIYGLAAVTALLIFAGLCLDR